MLSRRVTLAQLLGWHSGLSECMSTALSADPISGSYRTARLQHTRHASLCRNAGIVAILTDSRAELNHWAPAVHRLRLQNAKPSCTRLDDLQIVGFIG